MDEVDEVDFFPERVWMCTAPRNDGRAALRVNNIPLPPMQEPGRVVERKPMKFRSVAMFVVLMGVLALGHMAPHRLTTHWHEGNNTTGGWLVAEGWAVYRDFFSHHPPFPYWFAAPMVRLFGPSAATFRWALIIFYILALAVLFMANRRSARPFSFGLFALFVALGHRLYWGHLYLADLFSAFGLLVMFYQFWRFDERHPMKWYDWAVVGLAMFASVGSTLVATYPAALLALGLAVKHFRYDRSEYVLAKALGIAVLVAAPFAAAGTYLWATGSLHPFWEQVYLASTHHYRTVSGYASLEPSLSPLSFMAVNIAPRIMYLIASLAMANGAMAAALAWVNVSVIVVLVATRQIGMAVFYGIYLLLLMLRINDQYAAPYMVHTFWAAAWLFQPAGEQAVAAWRAFRQGAARPTATHADILRTAAAAVLLVLLAQVYIEEIIPVAAPDPPEKDVARVCAELTSPAERIAVFPNSPEIYREADRKPAVPSFSYLSWEDRVDNVRRAMVESIESQKASLIVINWWSPPSGGFAFHTYADEIRDAIRRNYQPLSIGAPLIYARNSSFHELLGRYERVRRAPAVEAPERNLVPMVVVGPTQVTQYLAVKDRIANARLEILVSALRQSDSWADIVFGAAGPDGAEQALVRDRLRTTEIRHFPGVSDRTYWHTTNLTAAGILRPGQRYFFRISSTAAEIADAIQVWMSPRQERGLIGETRCGGDNTSRTVCFRLSGVTRWKPRGAYPIVEQSLARSAIPVTTQPIRQTLTIPDATTLSAVALLLGRGAGAQPFAASQRTSATAGTCKLEILGEQDRAIASQTFSLPSVEGQWKTLAFSPVALKRGSRVTLAVQATAFTTPPLQLRTAGCDVYRDGRLSVAGEECSDDLCFKLYETAPHQGGQPDIALSAVDFQPAAPASISPREPLRLTLRLENRGASPTGSFRVEFFASPKNLSGPAAFLADSLPVANLRPGEVLEQTPARALRPLPDGLYTIWAVADPDGEIAEADEENNRCQVGGKDLLVIARQSQVNLAVDGFTVGGSEFRRGQAIKLAGRVSNGGKEAAGRFSIEFWASADPERPLRCFPICDPITIESLAPNSVIALADYPRTLRPDVPVGRLYIGCTADARDEVAETMESDNTATTGPVTIRP
jgi:hypothetical protein